MNAALAVLAVLAFPAAAGAAPAGRGPLVEVVFALDTTGSMSGLLEGAKRKVWAVANEIAKGRPAPRIRMGLVAYRDRGDSYVTKVFDLTEDLDAMYKELLSLSAGGGGDGPEHVLKALEDSIERMSWSRDEKSLRVVYLVGDAPPHEDYGDTPRLEELLRGAVGRGLVVNAVQCGSDSRTAEAWRKVARLGEGRFLPIPQDGGVAARTTPFDGRLAEASRRLEGTMLAYGRRKAEAREALALGGLLAKAAAPAAAADRAVFKAGRGFSGELDLARAVEEERVDLEKLEDEDLPEGFKGLTAGQRKAKLDAVLKERAAIKEEIAGLDAQRRRWLASKEAGAPRADSFDARLVESLKAQAAAKGIAY